MYFFKLELKVIANTSQKIEYILGPNRTRARQIKNCLFYVKNLSTLDLS